MRLILIHNPSAGNGHPSGGELVTLLRSLGHDVVYQSRKAPGLEQAISLPADALLLAGGDGTVSKILRPLIERNLPIMILPLGTANNLARSFGIEGSVERIAANLDGAMRRRLDIGTACGPWGGRHFIDGAGIGAFTQAMHLMHCRKGGGAKGADKLRKARETFRHELATAAPVRIDLRVDGECLSLDLLLLDVMNIGHLGPGLPLLPAADPGDGKLDLAIVGEAQRTVLLDWLDDHAPAAPPAVPTIQGRHIEVAGFNGRLRIGDSFVEGADAAHGFSIGIDTGRSLDLLVPRPKAGLGR